MRLPLSVAQKLVDEGSLGKEFVLIEEDYRELLLQFFGEEQALSHKQIDLSLWVDLNLFSLESDGVDGLW